MMTELIHTSIPVDAAGRILLPLIGSVAAAGKTSPEISDQFASLLLRGRYFQQPQVTVWITEAVDGKNAAAVFDLKEIPRGKADSPELRANDVVVVDGFQNEGAWREIVGALPVIGIWRVF